MVIMLEKVSVVHTTFKIKILGVFSAMATKTNDDLRIMRHQGPTMHLRNSSAALHRLGYFASVHSKPVMGSNSRSVTAVVQILVLAFLLLGTPMRTLPVSAQTLTPLVNFNDTTGRNPFAGLVQGNDGNFYGTTYEGGNSGYGTVFRMSPTGTLTTLVNFNSINGRYPYAGLVQGSDGNFYGTTYRGGSFGFGTVFRMSPTGVLTTLVSFNNTNGSYPYAKLVQGSDGNFYGTTAFGGSIGAGTVFRITATGILTTLVNFTYTNNFISGSNPYAPLIQGSDGNFYGTTYYGGGSTTCPGGCGTIFRMTPSGTLTSLISFNRASGAYPYAGLVQSSGGSFYGTTEFGGSSNLGTVFRLTATGILTTLVNFNAVNGEQPTGGLVQGSDGDFYGTTYEGGSSDYGTVFRMSASGILTTLINFSDGDGAYPTADLVQDSKGNFYGTTYYGGSSSYGTVFQLSSATIAPTITSFNPVRANFGSSVILTGTNFTEAIGVTFNGLPASFSVNSATQITATVPPGATSGLIQVTTAGGAATSNTFLVNPVAVRTLGWQQAGTADFNNDGQTDILWRNYTTGTNRVWFMNGTTYLGETDFSPVTDPTWQLVGAADFTADGQPDLLWRNFSTGQNSIWQMNGTVYITSFDIGVVSDLNYQLAGIGDLTGDGQPDLIWRNYSTGEVYVWQMNGYTYQQAFLIGIVSDPYWQMAGTGDLTLEGQPNLLWRYWGPGSGSGDVYLWQMSGYTYQTALFIGPVTDLNFQLTGVDDFTGDGQPDLVWSNNHTNENYVWQMSGYTYANALFIGAKPN